MSEDIIEYYKQANTVKDTGSVAAPVDVVEVREEVIDITQDIKPPEDPFERFLYTLNKNLKDKTVAQSQVVEEERDSIEESTPVVEEADPFGNFIDKLQGIVKSQKEQSIKDATLDFINELKNEDLVDEDKSAKAVSQEDEPPLETPIAKPQIPPVVKQKEQEAVKEEPKQEDAEKPYVKELQAIGETKKAPKKATKPNDIKALIAQQVEVQTSKILDDVKAYAKRVLDLGGGGGSVAQQFANGGTMNGSLNVTGQYLSGGVNLVNILSGSGGGGGAGDRLVSGSSSLILNSDGSLQFPNNTVRPADDTEIIIESENAVLSAFTQIALTPHGFFAYDNTGDSIAFDSVSNTIVFKTVDNYTWILDDSGNITGPSGILTISGSQNTTGRILSGGVDLSNIFLTTSSNSQTLTYTPSSYELSISDGNTVSLASLSGGGQSDLSFLSVSGNWNSTYTSWGAASATSIVEFNDTRFSKLSSQAYVQNIQSIQPLIGSNTAYSGPEIGCYGGFNVVGGGFNNSASGYIANTVAGGGYNSASGYTGSTVSGGYYNCATSNLAAVGGGQCNIASGFSSNVGGGYCNTASASYSNVGGGYCNTASGGYSSILGGCCNTVTHVNSFAIGSNIISSTDNTTYVNNLSSQGDISTNNLKINQTPLTFINPVTASGEFLIININGVDRAIQLWDFSS